MGLTNAEADGDNDRGTAHEQAKSRKNLRQGYDLIVLTIQGTRMDEKGVTGIVHHQCGDNNG